MLCKALRSRDVIDSQPAARYSGYDMLRSQRDHAVSRIDFGAKHGRKLRWKPAAIETFAPKVNNQKSIVIASRVDGLHGSSEMKVECGFFYRTGIDSHRFVGWTCLQAID